MMAVCVTVLFAFVALAIDLGMVILSRAAAQNAADTAALTGARTLDNRVPIGTLSDNYDNQKDLAYANAQASIASNSSLNLNTLVGSQVTVGVYDYDSSAQVFRPSFPDTKPTGKAWTAVSVTVSASQPSFFSRVFGINSLSTSATAVAAHRPRDIAIILDMSGSMKFSSTYNWPETGAVSGLMNPDTSYPRFGHYQRYPTTTMPNAFYRTTNFLQGSNEIYSPTNMSTDANVGPAMVRQFVFDPANLSNASSSISTVTNANNLKNAFHRWNPPGMSPLSANGEFGRMTSPTGWTGYNAFDTSNTSGPTPAPDTFATQEDGSAKYVGDRYPRKAGAVVTTNVNWDPTTATGAARTAWEVLFPTSVTTIPTLSTSTLRTVPATTRAIAGLGITDARIKTTAPSVAYALREGGSSWDKFIDSAWEMAGYDLDIAAYNAQTGAATASTFRPTVASKALLSTPANPTNGRFHGYSMGPAYYGKTFFVWPPDPRWGNPNGGTPLGGGGVRPDQVLERTNPASTDASKSVKDSNGNWICDWRRRFFLRGNSSDTGSAASFTYFDPQVDNDANTAGTQNINQALLNSSTGHTLKASIYSGSTRNFRINYQAVLAWIKSGPQVFPPNLRAGRIKFYSSIPDNVDSAGSPGTSETGLDQRFWREYIDYVLGYTANNDQYPAANMLAGVETAQWGGSNVSIGATNPETYTVSTTTYTNPRPYMNYSDVPARPRLHFWFGPMSMMMFISSRIGTGSSTTSRNWDPGTIAEAQTWQLKAGIRSALEDIKNNHPNDQAGMTFFAGTNFTTTQAAMSQDWDNLKNALYYPKTLLAGIKAGGSTLNTEKRPYTSSFGNALIGDLPNGNGSTDPVSGFALAYNLLSSSTTISGTGRRGATKIVIFETDGVPNSRRTFNFTAAGANSYYTSTATTGSGSNGDATCIAQALAIVDQIVASTSANGFSLDNSDARVYPIAFGDLFSSTSSYKASALSFLQEVAYRGKSSDSLATPLPAYQIIVGTADQRIESLRSSFERILQSGVQVTLIE